MKFYVNVEHDDLLTVHESGACAICYIDYDYASTVTLTCLWETLDNHMAPTLPTYRELIENGYFTEVTLNEIKELDN